MKFVTKDLTPEDLRWRVNSESTPAAGWIVGHVLVSHEQIVNQLLLENQPLLPDEFYTAFGFSTEGEFPPQFALSDVFSQFKLVTGKVVEELMANSEDWLEEFPDDSLLPPHWKNRNHMKVLVLHFNHVFTHSGQILELKRAREKGAWGF
jgi:hypothetical protein